MLYLRTATEVQQAADAIFDRVKWRLGTDSRSAGTKHGQPRRRAGAEIVVEHDPLFGPLIMLGEGGVEWRRARKIRPPSPFHR